MNRLVSQAIEWSQMPKRDERWLEKTVEEKRSATYFAAPFGYFVWVRASEFRVGEKIDRGDCRSRVAGNVWDAEKSPVGRELFAKLERASHWPVPAQVLAGISSSQRPSSRFRVCKTLTSKDDELKDVAQHHVGEKRAPPSNPTESEVSNLREKNRVSVSV